MQQRVAAGKASGEAGETTSSEAILERLVGFDTTSRNSNLALIDWVAAYLESHGIASERVFDETGEKANLFATIGPADAGDGVILSGHTDTVPVDGQNWSSEPFVLTARDGRLYGRGTADMKGFLACCLAKVPAMRDAALARPIHLAFSYDEEVGCVGVRRLIEKLKADGTGFSACLVGEPTAMQVVTAHKSKRAFEAVFTGLPCHSSLAPEGVNAVSYAARLVAKIDAVAGELAAGPSDPLYDMPVSTAQVGVIEGGAAVNIVPQHARVVFEFRMLPTEDIETVVGEVIEFCEALNAEMTARDETCGVRVEELSAIPGLDTAADAEVTRLAKRLARRNDHAKVAFGTEGGRFHDDLGVPTVVVGPGSIAQAHKADEFIAASELGACERFLDDLIAHQSTAP